MGREIRRVPLDFDWPLNKVWRGFINPHYKVCPQEALGLCRSGSTPASLWVDAVARLIALLGTEAVEEPSADRLRKRGMIFPHPYLEEWRQAPRRCLPQEAREKIRSIDDPMESRREMVRQLQAHPPVLMPFTGDLRSFVEGLAGKKHEPGFLGPGLGYDVYRALLKAAGIDPDGDWGKCPVCKGEGIDPANQAAYEAWRPEDPPAGDGWQLWETVSEGSPISPAFPCRAEFVDYLTGEGYSRGSAEAFCDSGYAPSGVFVGGAFHRDIESCAVLGEVSK